METQSAYYLGKCCTQPRGPWAEKMLPGGLKGKCPHVLHSGHAQKGMSGSVPWQEKLGQPTLLIRGMHSSGWLCSHSRVFFSRLLELEFQLCGLLLSQCWGSNPGTSLVLGAALPWATKHTHTRVSSSFACFYKHKLKILKFSIRPQEQIQSTIKKKKLKKFLIFPALRTPESFPLRHMAR